ncbi:MAG: hypothetical protein BroJett009_05690 [Armatimonadota bacterium]|nr:MAG: hypothetical protein EDM74_04515 [Armatimonadota bacterium]GIK31577.1 MAG: hypothetical protein BroJett009_05690 [Armatimonadota bacterium]
MPKAFEEKTDDGVSFHLCPEEWGAVEIEAYIDAFPVGSGARLGVLEVSDEDFDQAGIPRPVLKESGGPFSELHYETPILSDEQRATLAKVVGRKLPNACLAPFKRKPKQG